MPAGLKPTALVPDAGAPPIPGKVFRLTDAELAAADIYESENYRRERVVLARDRRLGLCESVAAPYVQLPRVKRKTRSLRFRA